MPDCEELKEAWEKAWTDLTFMDRAYHNAESNLDLAYMAKSLAEIGVFACVLTIESGPGCAICEVAALSAHNAAVKQIDVAMEALDLAEDQDLEYYYRYREAQKEYCDCMENQ